MVCTTYTAICVVIFIVGIIFSPDATLTVDNVTTVMELVTADRMMEVWGRLGVHKSLVEMATRNLLTPKKKTRACVDLYLNCHPNTSWKNIATGLYRCEEMAAAKEAKTFYHQNGKHHSLLM